MCKPWLDQPIFCRLHGSELGFRFWTILLLQPVKNQVHEQAIVFSSKLKAVGKAGHLMFTVLRCSSSSELLPGRPHYKRGLFLGQAYQIIYSHLTSQLIVIKVSKNGIFIIGKVKITASAQLWLFVGIGFSSSEVGF